MATFDGSDLILWLLVAVAVIVMSVQAVRRANRLEQKVSPEQRTVFSRHPRTQEPLQRRETR